MEAALHKTTREKMKNQGIDLERLKAYLVTKQEVAFSFLYGSHAKGTATKRSDADVTVYF